MPPRIYESARLSRYPRGSRPPSRPPANKMSRAALAAALVHGTLPAARRQVRRPRWPAWRTTPRPRCSAPPAECPSSWACPRTARAAGRRFSLDLHALIEARLPAGSRPTTDGRRVRVTSVLSEAPGRLVFSARLVEEPGGRLLDLVSVSMASDAGDLSLASVPWPGASGRLDVVRQARTATLPAPVLDLAFLDDARLVVLWAEELGLYRWEDGGLRLESRQALRGPRQAVRTPGGLLAVAEGEAIVLGDDQPRGSSDAVRPRGIAHPRARDRGRRALARVAQRAPLPRRARTSSKGRSTGSATGRSSLSPRASPRWR